MGDTDGDGLPDLVAFGDWGTDLAKSNLGDNDGRITLIDNNGKKTYLSYRPITDTSVYRKGATSRYPDLDFQAPIYVVYQTRQSTGLNANDLDLKRYNFEGAVLNLSGRGFRGFRRVTVNDYTAGIRRIANYELNFRYSGARLRSVEQRQIANNRLLSVTWNALRYVSTFSGRVHRSFVASSLTRNYELNGSLVSSTSSTFSYDGYGNLIRSYYRYQGGHQKTESYSYANIVSSWILGRLIRKTVTRTRAGKPALTKREVYRYDSSYVHLLQTSIEPNGSASLRKTATFGYDSFGNVTVQSTSAWNGRFTETRTARQYYDSRGRFVSVEYNPLGHKQTYFREPLLGLVTTTVGPNGVATYATYDGFGRKTSTYTPGAGRTTWAYSRYRLGHFSYIVTLRKDGTPERLLYYDILDRERQQTVRAFNGLFSSRTTEYDRMGRVSRVSEPFQQYFWWGNTRKLWTTRRYDILGRVTSVTQPDNTTSRTYYSGMTITKIDAKGNRQTEVQDIFGKVLRSYDAYGSQTTYDYDSHDNLISIRDPYGRITTMTYDLLDRKTRITDPDMGTSYYWFNGFSEQIAERNARGMTTTYRFDRLGRRTHRYEREGWTYWTYDMGLAGKGKLYRVYGPGGYSETNSYDKYGRLISTLYSGGGRSFRMSNVYDAFGRIAQIHYPSGFRIKNIYNRYGYLSEVRDLSTNALFWKLNSKNAQGQVLSESFGNGKTTTYSYYSGNGRVSRIRSIGVLDQRFGFDALGNLSWRSDATLKTSETFGYDRLNRLISSTVRGFTPVRITYDRTGNILSKSDVGNYRYSSSHPHGVSRVLGTGGKPNRYLSYDTSGNVLRDGSSSLGYTSYNKVRTIAGAGIRLVFDYGPGRDRRLQRGYLNGRLMASRYYAGPLYELQVVGSKVTHFNYILAGGRIIAAHKTGYGADTQYFHRDHLGSIQAITNRTGKVLQVASYDPWGRRRYGRNWAPGNRITSILHRGYTGHEHLEVGELIHLNGRVYDPILGRVLSADPLVKGRLAGQNLNRYSYVGNNPLSSLDPSGFFLGKLFKKIGRFFKKIWKPLVAIAIGAITGGLALGFFGLSSLTLGGAIVSGIAAGFASSATLTLLNGGSLGDALKAGLRGAVIGGITGGIMWGIKTGLRMALDRFIPKDAKLYYAEHIGDNVYKITEVDAIKGPRLFVNGILNGSAGDPTIAIKNGLELYGDSFTLLHNPSNGFFMDMLESFSGKVLGPSGEATQLAQWLKNAPGLKEIIAHSQGGIITTNALGILAREGVSLSGVQVTFVGAAVHQGAALGAVKAVNASFGGFYVNPTDAVPNLAGLNGNPITMIRSLFSLGRLTGSGFASPHSSTSYSVFFGGPHLGGASFCGIGIGACP
jgi:RHS repeat-associated protein